MKSLGKFTVGRTLGNICYSSTLDVELQRGMILPLATARGEGAEFEIIYVVSSQKKTPAGISFAAHVVSASTQLVRIPEVNKWKVI